MPIAIPFLLFALLLLTAFLGQNLEPAVSIVLLGVNFPKLPLGVWILAALGLGMGISVSFLLLLSIARRTRQHKPGIVGSKEDVWDDPDWNDGSNDDSVGNGGQGDRKRDNKMPKAPDIDAEFRVITPPIRNLEDDD